MEDKVVKSGVRKNKYVTKQRYLCKRCNKRFIEPDGFQHMSYPKEIVVKVLHLYVAGLSLSKIREYVYQHEGFHLRDSVIGYWIKKYAHMLSTFEKTLIPKVKGRIHTDEVFVRVGTDTFYSINTIDSKTKYILATTFVKKRTKLSCRVHFKKLKEKIGAQVKERWKKERDKPQEERKLITFVSDKFEGYKDGFNHYFYRFGRLVFGVPIACKKYGLKHNNNPIERENEDIKQRYKTMRGFKSFSGGEAFFELRRIYRNFVHIHPTLNKTPAEASGITLPLGRNKFLGIIFFFDFYSPIE
ncbi:MAG: DDE-type integrase/transposase/recombinase [Thermoplasmata archaeon]|nr:DDE-type integrase/transposase/recombinase [Thermoplasmata archaeon]